MSLSEMSFRATAAKGSGAVQRSSAPGLARAIAAIAAYFPTETVGTYFALLAIVQPQANGERWSFFALFLLFTGVVAAYYAWHEQHGEGAIDRARLAWLLAFAGFSFTIWSAMTPWTPFLQLTDEAQRYAGIAAIVLAPLFPMGAQVVGISPPWR